MIDFGSQFKQRVWGGGVIIRFFELTVKHPFCNCSLRIVGPFITKDNPADRDFPEADLETNGNCNLGLARFPSK
jgi:hypothetical protein